MAVAKYVNVAAITLSLPMKNGLVRFRWLQFFGAESNFIKSGKRFFAILYCSRG